MKSNLVFIHPHFTLPGGAGKVVLELASRLNKSYNVIVISQKISGDFIKNYSGLSFISLDGPTTDSFLFWLLFPYWMLKTWITANKFITLNTKVICSVFPSNWIIFPLKLFKPKLKIIWLCQEPSAFVQNQNWINTINNPIKKSIAIIFNPLFKLIDNNLAKIPNVLIANSKYSQNIIQKTYHRESTVIYPGVNTKIFKPIPYSKKENIILTVSRLTKFKNINILIKAFSKLKEDSYKLIIIGNGKEKENLQKLINKLNLTSKAKILVGIFDKELLSCYQKSKLFVLCSKNEPFGIVPVEAMACGTPVIADNSGGPMETVKQNKTGILINCNVANLSNTISSLLKNQNQLKLMSKLGPEWVQNNFNWETSVKKLLTLL